MTKALREELSIFSMEEPVRAKGKWNNVKKRDLKPEVKGFEEQGFKKGTWNNLKKRDLKLERKENPLMQEVNDTFDAIASSESDGDPNAITYAKFSSVGGTKPLFAKMDVDKTDSVSKGQFRQFFSNQERDRNNKKKGSGTKWVTQMTHTLHHRHT